MTSFCAKKVVFVVFPDVKLLDLAGPLQVFTDANFYHPGTYELSVVSMGGGQVGTDTVMPVQTTAISSASEHSVDAMIVVGGAGAYAAAQDVGFVREVASSAAKARRVASVCTGAFILAEAGLLSGRKAVTHWESCDQLRAEYSDIEVVEDAIFVTDGHVRTSAGVTAGIDMCLDMVAEDLGRKAALDLARSLVCYLVRPGGQSQFSAPLQQQSQAVSGKFDSLNAWIPENLSADLSVDALAEREGMSPRNFSRLYRQHTGLTPAKAVEAFRVNAVCRLLEETDLPLIKIADMCGFRDDERMRRALMRSRAVAPGEYRQRFGRKHEQVMLGA